METFVCFLRSSLQNICMDLWWHHIPGRPLFDLTCVRSVSSERSTMITWTCLLPHGQSAKCICIGMVLPWFVDYAVFTNAKKYSPSLYSGWTHLWNGLFIEKWVEWLMVRVYGESTTIQVLWNFWTTNIKAKNSLPSCDYLFSVAVTVPDFHSMW